MYTNTHTHTAGDRAAAAAAAASLRMKTLLYSAWRRKDSFYGEKEAREEAGALLPRRVSREEKCARLAQSPRALYGSDAFGLKSVKMSRLAVELINLFRVSLRGRGNIL